MPEAIMRAPARDYILISLVQLDGSVRCAPLSDLRHYIQEHMSFQANVLLTAIWDGQGLESLNGRRGGEVVEHLEYARRRLQGNDLDRPGVPNSWEFYVGWTLGLLAQWCRAYPDDVVRVQVWKEEPSHDPSQV